MHQERPASREVSSPEVGWFVYSVALSEPVRLNRLQTPLSLWALHSSRAANVSGCVNGARHGGMVARGLWHRVSDWFARDRCLVRLHLPKRAPLGPTSHYTPASPSSLMALHYSAWLDESTKWLVGVCHLVHPFDLCPLGHWSPPPPAYCWCCFINQLAMSEDEVIEVMLPDKPSSSDDQGSGENSKKVSCGNVSTGFSGKCSSS